ncbi:phospholipase a2 domain-containing protein [Phthorimaea operculella]|nr:phospholipase a2 domain-containing protein [Phthorimaea operculella]
MYHRQRRKIFVIFLFISCLHTTLSKSIDISEKPTIDPIRDNIENNIIDFDEDYTLKFNKKYGVVPWETNEKFNKETHRYTLVKEENKTRISVKNETEASTSASIEETTLDNDYSVVPLELISTTEDALKSIIESTTEQDLTVIPLSTTEKVTPSIDFISKNTVTVPASTENSESATLYDLSDKLLMENDDSETTTIKREVISEINNNETVTDATTTVVNTTAKIEVLLKEAQNVTDDAEDKSKFNVTTEFPKFLTETSVNKTAVPKEAKSNDTEKFNADNSESKEDFLSFTEVDSFEDVPEDYYDNKDVVPTTAPKTDAVSVIFGLAGSLVESVVESVAERVVPKSIYDLFKRMQRQSEALEAERLRSKEENGGLGQFGRGILKSISSGLSKPLSQLMQGVKDIGSLDNDRGFVSSLASNVASGVTSVSTSVSEAFKDRVHAIYPGTVWCGDGHAPTARSGEVGLFFFTDSCCKEHDACKIFIPAGETKETSVSRAPRWGEVGLFFFTDSCCKEHDACKIFMPAGETKYGL